MSEYSNWCRSMYAVIKDGGRWGLPSTGLIFEKRPDKKLVLVEAVFGFGSEQRILFEQTRKEFVEIGVIVETEVFGT